MASFFQEESDKVLATVLNNISGHSDRQILKDGDDSWYKIPYQTSFGYKFKSVKDDIIFRTQNLLGIDRGGYTGIQHPDPVSSSHVSKIFGLDNSDDTLRMLDSHYYQDTRVGGNDAINCLWQFNRDDDILHDVSVTTVKSGNKIGLSRVYANTTQTNQQLVYFTFGVPYYTSITSFYPNAFNKNLIDINQQGYDSDVDDKFTISGLFFDAFKLVLAIPILPVKMIFGILNFDANVYKVNRFYELRGRMQLYYRYVDSMLGHWLVASGLYGNGDPMNSPINTITASEECLPAALRISGASIWDIISRRAANAGFKLPSKDKRIEIFNKSLYGKDAVPLRYSAEKDKRVIFQRDELIGSMNSLADTTLNNTSMTNGNLYGYDSAESDMLTSDDQDLARAYENSKLQNTFLNNLRSRQNNGDILAYEDDHGDWTRVFYKSALGATQFIGFRVDKSTDASESFSNSTAPSAFAENFNAKVREAAAQLTDMGVKGASSDDGWVNSIISGIKDIGRSVLDAINHIDFIGLTDLANAAMTGAFIDIPEQYSGSDFNKSHSLSFQLRSPYGDKVSIYQSIIVPLFCILAGALPRAGGPNAYVQPFLCRVYCKGMFAIPMGIIDSISIKRGDSEFGWTYDTIPTCIDVNISIKDMSPVMYMMMYDKAFGDILGSDNAFNEYLLTISGVGLFDRISSARKILRGMTYTAHMVRGRYFNPMYWSHSISQYGVMQFVSSFIPKTTIPTN